MTAGTLRAALAITLLALATSAVSCSSPRPATEMLIEVDADSEVRARAASVRVEVFGRASSGSFPATAMHVLPYSVPESPTRWGPVVVLFPENRDATRFYRVRAIALDAAGVEITRVQLISSYVSGVSLRFRLYLQSSCEGVVCDLDAETCVDGVCTDAEVDPRTLLDGGTTMDGGVTDSGPRPDGGLDAPADGGGGCPDDCDDGRDCTTDRCVADACVHDVACDDGIDCTQDACEVGGAGACVHTAMDSLCTDGTDCEVGTCDVTRRRCVYTGDDTLCEDGSVCTLDVCGGAGCVFPALTGTSCADTVFCNGAETCNAAGACVSPMPADPCPGASTCDPGMDRCTGCSGDADCPADDISRGGCGYADVCDETATRTVTTTTYACAGGTCQPSTSTSAEVCPDRDTDGMSCPGSSCSADSCEVFSGTCDSTGVLRHTCIDMACAAGTCQAGAPRIVSTGLPCTRPTDGVSCGSTTCGPPYCRYASVCDEIGLGTRDCSSLRCRSDSCVSESSSMSAAIACDRPTDGSACGTCQTCFGGMCGLPMCGIDAGPPPPDAPDPLDAGRDAEVGPSDGGPAACTTPCCITPSLCGDAGRFCCRLFGPSTDGNGCSPTVCPP